MNLNKSWKAVIGTTAGIFLVSFVIGLVVHAVAQTRYWTPSTPQWQNNMKTITVDDAYKAFSDGKAVFVDTRDNAEYQEGHIQGAINIPDGDFGRDFPRYKKLLSGDSEIITYCHGTGCDLSVDIARSLMAAGYKNVYVLTEGWPGWVNAQLPIAVGKEP